MKEKPDFGGRECLGLNSLFLNVHFLCCFKKTSWWWSHCFVEQWHAGSLAMASSFLWWTRQNQSQVQTGQRWEGRPFPCQLLSTCVLPPVFPVYDPKNSKIGYSDNTTMIQMPGGSRCVHSKCVWDHQSAESWTLAMQCNLPMRENAFPLQRRLWQAEQQSSRKQDNSNHSFSSGFWGSMILTCVKGKSPLRPFTSPSHWPFIFILVTFTMSPTSNAKAVLS